MSSTESAATTVLRSKANRAHLKERKLLKNTPEKVFTVKDVPNVLAKSVAVCTDEPEVKNLGNSKVQMSSTFKIKDQHEQRQSNRIEIMQNLGKNIEKKTCYKLKGGSSDTDQEISNGKSKVILNDPKFRNNRIEKSSSKTKIVDFSAGNKKSIKKSTSTHKIASAMEGKAAKLPNVVRSESAFQKFQKGQSLGLNLNALMRVVLTNKIFAAGDNVTIRRKCSRFDGDSSNTTSAFGKMTAKCKTLPVMLKNHSSSIVANIVRGEDRKAEKNVVLVKKQPLNLDDECADSYGKVVHRKEKTIPNVAQTNNATLVLRRYNSGSSKSSGNFEDEAFYSCDENATEESNDDFDNKKVDEILSCINDFSTDKHNRSTQKMKLNRNASRKRQLGKENISSISNYKQKGRIIFYGDFDCQKDSPTIIILLFIVLSAL